MRSQDLTINDRTLLDWKRPAELLSIVTDVQNARREGWIKSSGRVPMLFRELWQAGVAFYGLEKALGKTYHVRPTSTEPFDSYAAIIDAERGHADYMTVQHKMATNFLAKETNNFEPRTFAEHVKEQIEKYGNDPELMFLLYFNADARLDHYALHEALKNTLTGEFPIWLFGLETDEARTQESWFVRYIYPGIRKPGKHQFRIEGLPAVAPAEVERYYAFVEKLTV